MEMLNPLNLSRGFRIGGPGANSTSIATTQKYKSDDPIRQGFFDSTFFKPNAISTADMANYTYNGKSMQGSSSQIGQFGEYLDSIGKGDLLQRQNNSFAQQPGIGGLLSSAPGENPYERRGPIPTSLLNLKPRIPDYQDIPFDKRTTPPTGGTFNGMPLQPGNKYIDNLPGKNFMEQLPGNTMPENTMADPPQGIGSLTPTPQQPMMPTMPGNTMPENTMGGNNSFGNPLMGGINNLSEFGKPPSFGGNSFGNTMGGNNVFQNPFTGFQSNQQSFNDNQGMSSYIDNLINQRMKDIFGGIMGIFE
jgi:hypothetical protein